MRKLQTVLVGLIVLFAMQFTLVSCEDNGEIIKSKDEQIQNETKMVVPGNAGDQDDDDDEEGSI
ncbi:MAG: hypothetical protein L3J20_07175 [Flavobacteriaceae bacterium]|nr:hypothetical protein [Flavobacteriaceae bacterium]